MPRTAIRPPRVLRLASKLGVEPSNHVALNRIECGLHSGFAPCCIAFFVTVWGPLMDAYDGELDQQDPLALGIMDGYRTFADQHAPQCGYVPCPACVLSGSVRKVKPCNCTRRRRSR